MQFVLRQSRVIETTEVPQGREVPFVIAWLTDRWLKKSGRCLGLEPNLAGEKWFKFGKMKTKFYRKWDDEMIKSAYYKLNGNCNQSIPHMTCKRISDSVWLTWKISEQVKVRLKWKSLPTWTLHHIKPSFSFFIVAATAWTHIPKQTLCFFSGELRGKRWLTENHN